MNLPTVSEQQALEVLGGMPSIEAVRRLEDVILQFPQINLNTTNLIHGGMYARTIFIPAGTVLTGALTNMDNICVLFGDITVTTDEGPQHLRGFHVLPAKAGAKRVGVAHADTWWTTLISTEEAELSEIEKQMTDEHEGLQTNRSGALFLGD